MSIITCDDWTEAREGEREYEWAPTSDPRVLAVIERDNYASISELYDGDAIDPIIYVDHRNGLRFEHMAGYDGGEAELMQRAYDEWGWNGTARRYLWIFHGIAADNANGGYDRSGNWIVATSRSFREHVGAEDPATFEEARVALKGMVEDVEAALDGYVYGVGFATNEEHVLHDDGEEIDLTDGAWDIEIACWGFVGEQYAKGEAASFSYEEPALPDLLDFHRQETPVGVETESGEY